MDEFYELDLTEFTDEEEFYEVLQEIIIKSDIVTKATMTTRLTEVLKKMTEMVKRYIRAEEGELVVHKSCGGYKIRVSSFKLMKEYDSFERERAGVFKVPILSGDGQCLAEARFFKEKCVPFTENEKKLAKFMLTLIGKSVRDDTGLAIEDCTFRRLLRNISEFVNGALTIEQTVSRNLKYLQKRTRAGVINLYRVGACGSYKMYGQVRKGSFLEVGQPFKLEPNEFFESILKLNIAVCVGADSIKRLTEERKELPPVHPATKVDIKNYLCLPAGHSSTVQVIVELINKEGEDSFNGDDLIRAFDCARMCSALFYYEQESVEDEDDLSAYSTHNSFVQKNLTLQKSVIASFFQKVKTLKTPKGFYRFDFYPKSNNEMDFLCWLIFKDVFSLSDTESLESLSAIYVIISAKMDYNENHFHNFEHGFAVCHCMYLITRNNRHFFSDLDVKALTVATLCHDIDHPGWGNPYFKFSRHPLTLLYGSSYLEHHHAIMTKKIVQKSKLFEHLEENDYKYVMNMIEAAILKTDLATFFDTQKHLKRFLAKGNFDDQNPKHREHIIGISMTASDLSGQAKPFHIASYLCRKLIAEQSQEARTYKNLRMRLSITLQKMVLNPTAEFQIDFINSICLPCFELIGKFLMNVSALYIKCKQVKEVWEGIERGEIEWDEREMKRVIPGSLIF